MAARSTSVHPRPGSADTRPHGQWGEIEGGSARSTRVLGVEDRDAPAAERHHDALPEAETAGRAHERRVDVLGRDVSGVEGVGDGVDGEIDGRLVGELPEPGQACAGDPEVAHTHSAQRRGGADRVVRRTSWPMTNGPCSGATAATT